MPDEKHLKRLLRCIRAGDEQAFRKLFEQYSSTVYSFSMKLTRRAEQAEEIVQDVFMKLWVRRESLDEIENFPAYLFTVTKHLALNILRQKAIESRAKAVLQQIQEGSHCETEETVVLRDYEQLLDRAIRHLPPQQRVVYSLCRHEGLRYEEVAQRLKISRLTVKAHMHQALRTIKSQFADIVRVSVVFLPLLPAVG